MSASNPASTRSPGTNRQNNRIPLDGFRWLFVLLFVAGYLLPWATTPTAAGLTFSGYDLSEWASLHPDVRAETPALLTSLLLRLPAILIIWMMAAGESARRFRSPSWWLTCALIIVATVALLPPLEFITDAAARADVNYRQQFTVAVLTASGGVALLIGLPHRWRMFVWSVCGFAALASGIWGAFRAIEKLQDFGAGTQPGLGLWMSGCLLTIAVLAPIVNAWINKGAALDAAPSRINTPV